MFHSSLELPLTCFVFFTLITTLTSLTPSSYWWQQMTNGNILSTNIRTSLIGTRSAWARKSEIGKETKNQLVLDSWFETQIQRKCFLIHCFESKNREYCFLIHCYESSVPKLCFLIHWFEPVIKKRDSRFTVSNQLFLCQSLPEMVSN